MRSMRSLLRLVICALFGVAGLVLMVCLIMIVMLGTVHALATKGIINLIGLAIGKTSVNYPTVLDARQGSLGQL